MSDRGTLVIIVATTALLALIGLLRPDVALRAVVILCVVAAAAVLIDAVRRFLMRVPPAPSSPFREPTIEQPPGVDDHELPWHYSGLVPSRTATPLMAPGTQSALRTIATELLWDRYRLNVWLPDHAAAISNVLSEPLWALINPFQPTPLTASAFRHDHLQRHLDELDAL